MGTEEDLHAASAEFLAIGGDTRLAKCWMSEQGADGVSGQGRFPDGPGERTGPAVATPTSCGQVVRCRAREENQRTVGEEVCHPDRVSARRPWIIQTKRVANILHRVPPHGQARVGVVPGLEENGLLSLLHSAWKKSVNEGNALMVHPPGFGSRSDAGAVPRLGVGADGF